MFGFKKKEEKEEQSGEETPKDEETPKEETPEERGSSDIDDMLKTFNYPDAEPQEEDSTEEDVEEQGERQEEAPAEEKEEETDPKYQAFLDKIAELEQKLPGEEPKEEETPGEDPTSFVPTTEELEDIDYFADKDIRDILDDEDTFKEWFKESIKKTREADRQAFMTSVYKSLPQIINTHVNQQVEAKQKANEFYTQNPDLAEHKEKVAEYANKIASLKPNIGRDEFYDEVAKYARYELGLKAQGEKKTQEKQRPALNNKTKKATTRKEPTEELQGTEAEIDAMMQTLRR